MSEAQAISTKVSEPIFNCTQHGVTPEMLYDWINMLLKKNAEHVQSAKPCQGSCILMDSVQFLFLTCEKLKMSPEVKYLSIELFDRFMLQHVRDLHDHVIKNCQAKTRSREWTDIKKRVTNQVVLRIVSCVQIASKMTSHYRILSPAKARRYLQEAGHRYNTESILQSELRVLKTLNFKVALPSPLVYMEAVLEAIGLAESKIALPPLYTLCQSLQDLVYLQYEGVYSKLHQVAAGGSPITGKDRESFACVRADKMLMTVAIVTAAAYIVDRDNHDRVLQLVSELTSIPDEDIADFASIILQLVMENSED
ncbi:cyclin N-terminal domain-containing protein 1-like [Mya arenaria]|uniref:cyclin N-terminal domain-containing protein 1-like n=1 Tax=Mya arenaria TaxID=6604 RepID=UPI0022DFE553|nr:cyclin N-terminal domain-containing protein 1-like [Mya arenaria]